MEFSRRTALAAATLAASAPATTPARAQTPPIRLGVLTDMSSLYSDVSGPGSVEAARMAIEKLGGKIAGMPVELVFADHQNKADVGANIARRWYENEGVDVILDVPNSAVALAVSSICFSFSLAHRSKMPPRMPPPMAMIGNITPRMGMR